MKYVKIAVVVLFVAFIAIQFYRPDFTNPPVVESENLLAGNQVPENVKAILVRSCSDCHTNETVYPWYSKISPSSWFLADHIDEVGRKQLNFSIWNTYETRRKDHKLEEICEHDRIKRNASAVVSVDSLGRKTFRRRSKNSLRLVENRKAKIICR